MFSCGFCDIFKKVFTEEKNSQNCNINKKTLNVEINIVGCFFVPWGQLPTQFFVFNNIMAIMTIMAIVYHNLYIVKVYHMTIIIAIRSVK